jgi:HEAT repeat protein
MVSNSKIAASIADLNHTEKSKIRAAVDALIPLAASSQELRETLHQLILDPQGRNPWSAAYVLAHCPRPDPKIIQTLLDGLDHREADIRWAIALLLIHLAKSEPEIVKSLFDLCVSGTSAQKRMAVYCIRDLRLADKNSLEVLLKLLEETDPTVRVAAVISLKVRLDLDARGRETLLRLFLDDPDFRVRAAAAVILAKLGSPSNAFLNALRQAEGGDNPQLVKAAATALALLQT